MTAADQRVVWPELLPVVAMAVRIEHGPRCPHRAEARRVAALLDRAADPSHPEHGNAVAAATAYLNRDGGAP
jgi:hypothetical protein